MKNNQSHTEEMIKEEAIRFLIRRVRDGLYYNGKETFGYMNFEAFDKAKVFKNIAGAKMARNELIRHNRFYATKTENVELDEYEIVLVSVKPTGDVIR